MDMKTNVFNSKRFLSLLLALAMVFSMLPMTSLPAFAADTTPSADKAIMLGTSGISGYDSTNGYDYIYMGYWTVLDSYTASGEIKWRVLDDQTNTGESGLFLLSDVLLGTSTSGGVHFDNSGSSNVWQGSTAQAWCKDFAGEEGAATNVTNAFSAGELGALLATTKSDQAFTSSKYGVSFSASENILNGDKVFFLSAEEVENAAYGFTDDNARVANYGTSAGEWWLRSPSNNFGDNYSGSIFNGFVYYDLPRSTLAARPAFNLDLNAVLFTSAAEGGKQGTTGTIAEISTSETTEWKLTLKDSSRSGFAAETTGKNGDILTVSYSGATTGANEYISVMIADSTGAYTHYGRIKNITEDTNASGTVEINLSGIDMTGKTLYVFNEQYNGGANDDTKLTDYASNFEDVIFDLPVLWVGGTAVTSQNSSGEGWSYDRATNTLTLNGASITSSYDGGNLDHSAGIYATEALNIVLTGSNTISGSNCGIYADAALNISGDGSLTATGNYDGIKATGDVTISGGTVTANGTSSYGICAEGKVISITGGYVAANGGNSGSGIVASTVVLGDSSHLVVTHNSATVWGTINATGGWCRNSADGDFSDTVAASGTYFEYIGSDHVTYTNKNAQDHTVSCVHGVAFDEAHEYESGVCAACSCEGGNIDVSILSSDLIITATGYSMNGNTYLYEGDYTLTGTTSYGVIFEAGEYQLTANNLKIVKRDIYSGSAIDLKNGATLHLVLADGSDNTLTGGWEGSGIRVNEGTSLTISGNGILRAGYQRGGNAAHGAAIGGYCNSNFGTITINGGTIYATGTRGASIGSGDLYNTSNTMAGTIVLNSGTIYADLIGNAESSGAVLKGSGATVYCNSIKADTSGLNAIVYSKDGTSATYYCNDFIVTGDIANCSWNQTNKVLNINGGTVTVSNADKNAATSQRIYIQGTANVTLNGVNISSTTGAPIEIRDYNDTNVTLTLSGSNTLISQTANKAAIHKTRGQQATSSAAATLTINGSGSLTAVGGSNAAGIGGGGYRGDTHNIIINSGTISATGKGWAAGIGSSDDGSTWNIVINGGNVTANGMPGIGANTDNGQGVKDASITGGMVTTNSYKGSTPTGGLVSTDGGKTLTVYSNYTLSQDLTIATDGKLTVAEGTKLTIADGFTLTNKGVIVNDGTISGNLVNEGTIYNKGTLPANVSGSVYEQHVTVNNGSGTGNYTEGSTVTITADAPASGKMFTGWTIELGTITLGDSTKAETTFTMPEGCVIVKANYADIVATVTDSNGNVKYYSDGFRAQEEWTRNGGTLTVHSDDFCLEHMDAPDGSVLDLNGHSVEPMMLHIRNSCTIQNGTISIWHEGIVEEDAVVTFKNVTITNDEHSSWEIEITNNGTIVDEGLTLNGVTISGAAVKTGITEDRVTLSGIPTEGYVYDGTAHEPSVKCGETTLVAGTDYTVTFSHSNGGNSTVNAGTITMTITGIGNYAGTVTKTYTITKAQAVGTAPTAVSGLVYNKSEQTLIAAGSTNDGTMVYSLEKEGEYTPELPQATAAGTYYVWYKVIGDGNHNGTTPVSVEVKIDKAESGIGAVTADVVNDRLETSAIVLTRANTNVAGNLIVDAGQTLVLGENEITYTFVPTDTTNYKTVTGTVTVTVVDTIAPVIAGVNNGVTYYTTQKVTINDKNIDTITLNGEAVTGTITLEGNKEATYIIVATDKAGNTTTVTVKMAPIADIVESVEGMTSDNVTPDDKSDLEKAKADLEKALKDNNGNYTADEKKAIEDELKRIDDALKVIENVEAVEDATSNLPATVVPDDEENVTKIEAAKKAYDKLTDYEKSLVDPETKEKLDKLTAAAVAYDIIKGDDSEWTKGTDGSVTFTVNGPISKFSGIKIDGKAVDAQYYDIKAGSTIITLKASYLETLAAGEHSITVVYTDGETSGTFNVQAKSTTPATGDNSNMFLWFALLFISGGAVISLNVVDRKRKAARK